VGLNLQAASVVINLDLPWNPARLEQRIARAWRKHQTRPVQVIHLVTEGSIEHRMIPLLAGKQALADSVLDGRGDHSEMPLPSGRRALVERLEALTGIGTSTGLAAPAHPPEMVREEPLAGLGEHLGIDPATLSAIERLIEAGLLQLSAEGRRLLHRPPDAGEPDAERERRLARARETFAQAERKIRMAAVLAGGGFPVEALPSLREGVELGLRSRAHLEGAEPESSEAIPLDWIEGRLPRHLSLIRKLRCEPETLLGAGEDEVRTWLAAGEQLAGEIRRELQP
jgi:hypothetical protein